MRPGGAAASFGRNSIIHGRAAAGGQREVDTPDSSRDDGREGRPPAGPASPPPLSSCRPEGGKAVGECDVCHLPKEYAAERARLAVWLAHELRTPLNCVLGYTELLCDQLEAPGHAPLLSDALKVRDLALHQLALLDGVLDLARLEHGSVALRCGPVEAIRLLASVAESTLPLVRRRGSRILLAAEGEAWVQADETRLRQILMNLVGNATKFTSDGLITLGVTAFNGSVSLHVGDTGCGMTPEEAERLFQPFHQANASVAAKHGGSGLGLAISKELCERMGGTISVRTAPGEGTTFTVTLPAAPKARPSSG